MLSLVFIAFSCSDNVIDDELNKQNLNEERKSSMALSVDQAKIYASMFCNYLDEKDADPESNLKTRSSGKVNKELSNIDYYIENGDTLLYAFNYKDDNGYIIAKENCHTNKKGIFVAGDARTKELRQLVTATSDGAIACTEAIKYINSRG